MKNNKNLTLIYYVGMALLIAGILLHITDLTIAFWVYTVGLLPVVGIRIYYFMIALPDDRRKYIPYLFSGISFVAAAVAIYYNSSYWVIFIALAALLDFYFSYRVKIEK